MIHPTAVIHPKAQLDSTVSVGPYAVIDENVVVGPQCRIGPHVHLTGHTTIGAQNQFHAGCVIGDAPQDLKYKGEPTRVRISERNVFREHVTVNRSARMEEDTEIGSDNFFMGSSHVGHNSQVGNFVIMANGAMLGGHATVQDRAFISGNCMVHQFVRVGKLALMQGGSGLSLDLPPFCIARGVNGLCGLNVVGMRRNGFGSEQRLEIKRLYLRLFRSGEKFSSTIAAAREEFTSEASRLMLDFVSASKRGICPDTSSRKSGGDEPASE